LGKAISSDQAATTDGVSGLLGTSSTNSAGTTAPSRDRQRWKLLSGSR